MPSLPMRSTPSATPPHPPKPRDKSASLLTCVHPRSGGPPISPSSCLLQRQSPDHSPRRAVWGWVPECLPLEMDLEGGRSLASVGRRRRVCPSTNRKQPTSIFSIFEKRRRGRLWQTQQEKGAGWDFQVSLNSRRCRPAVPPFQYQTCPLSLTCHLCVWSLRTQGTSIGRFLNTLSRASVWKFFIILFSLRLNGKLDRGKKKSNLRFLFSYLLSFVYNHILYLGFEKGKSISEDSKYHYSFSLIIGYPPNKYI